MLSHSISIPEGIARSTPRELRHQIRSAAYDGPTAGLCEDALQANLVILPETDAADFLRFCQQNPRPCPLLAVSAPGDPTLPTLGEDIDLRHDLPRYRIWRDGVLEDEPTDIADLWRDDLVSFAHRLFLQLRGCADPCGHPGAPSGGGAQRADVSHEHAVPGPPGSFGGPAGREPARHARRRRDRSRAHL